VAKSERNEVNLSKDAGKMKEESKVKTALALKKELAKIYSNPFGNPENVSAKAYIIIEHFKNRP
jgi:hypothetical protein